MFKFSPNLTFWWPVKVIEPHPDEPGKLVEHEFEAKFETVPPEEGKAWLKARNALVAKITPDLSEAEIEALQSELDEHDLKRVKNVLRDWRNVSDADGKVIPFNDTTFRLLYDHIRVRNGIVRAYLDALSEDKARLGN
ncbi:hypothetical protein [Brucella anthropi]|uniref:hypothetical protein n=1 Tax=Brucella anthropi TaxID=529 RepID=UPI000F67A9BD|nr:hypothetical protein [Brucella anthropi]RRY09007.1 hypothetical protein EGJ58_14120 [Brucella anthropi]